MIHVAVNKNREETKSTIGSEVTYDAADSKPLGRSVADTPALNTRNESIRLGTWNVRTLNHAGNMDNLTQEMEEMKTDILLSLQESALVSDRLPRQCNLIHMPTQ